MNAVAAKTIKEDISRATAYARRSQALKALQSAQRAFERAGEKGALVGRAKSEVEALLGDMLRVLDLLPEVNALLGKPMAFKRGMEPRYAQAMGALALRVQQMEGQAEAARQEEAQARIAQALDKVRQLVAEKNLPAARRLLTAVCDQHPDEPGIFTTAAELCREAGLYVELIPLAEKAMEMNPKDAKAFSLAIEACQQIGEDGKAETLLREAMRQFGAHPRTYVTLAKVLYKMRKWEQAYDAARSAVDRDPSLAEAREILELTEKRVMG